MAWLRIRLEVSAERASWFADWLCEAGAVAVSLEDAADQPLYEPPPGSQPLWAETWLTGLFPQDSDPEPIIQGLRALLREPLHYGIEWLEDRDWQAECQQQFQPRRFGPRLWVHPSWHTPPDPSAVNLLLDPGLAFGTGAHPTTALCLEWLAETPMQGTGVQGTGLDGAVVIDYGCGSGILSVAAALLGARQVWAVDIDPQALQATSANARLNGVAGRVQAVLPQDLAALQAQVLIANILARPLMELAPRFARLVRPGGRATLSGLLGAQTPEVAAVYAPWFELQTPAQSEGWALLTGVRRGMHR